VIAFVDKEVSFGKRTALTVTGDGTSLQPTQNRVIFRNQDTSTLLLLDFLYLPKPLEDDLVSWDPTPAPAIRDVENVQKFHQNVLSFRNTLVKLTVVSESDQPVDPRQLTEISIAVVKFLQNAEANLN
jgi:hypothetical protein